MIRFLNIYLINYSFWFQPNMFSIQIANFPSFKRCNIFFSKFQKKVCWPKIEPMTINKTWYTGNKSNIFKRINKNKDVLLYDTPKIYNKGLVNRVEAEPVIANTINMIVS